MPPVAKMDLADDQRFALMKLRRNVSDILHPGQDDHYLLRWLRARNFHPEAAEKMLRESMEWRKRWDVDNLQNWEPPLAIAQHFPSGICGLDRDSIPVVVVPFGSLDMYGMLHAATKADFVRMTARTLEAYLNEASRVSKELGRPSSAPQLVVLFDMDGFQLKQYTWRPVGEAILSLVHMYEGNYPEILKSCLIINAPSVFSVAFAVIRPFLHENTVRKIQIFSANPRKWRPPLEALVDPSQLPAHYGGTLYGPNNDPKCTDKVPLGGKVPKTMYRNTDSKEKEGEHWSTATVKKGDKFRLSFPIEEIGSYLKWEFRTEQHDIQFAVYRTGMDGQQVTVVAPRRISAPSDGTAEVGVLTCDEAPANYMLEFDNTYSMMRNKKLHYQVEVTPPVNAPELAESLAAISVS
ncbi:hypothetical protein B566_EDAN014368 [Ephemera danica]|nr:hypothetical protein B566_EDAN014368 [Ephemera danica]